ncbi:phytanoyl-CoA dioxygenase family protein [Phenylobacterium montanum]|uniref:Phytanoyl-CoA dioxygenase family protein n=1 Tax=Phenylobacterium montanum TaxID=2823693 RepID=A0A975FVJ8_9CAUL|nr:phytanoyl-CoA dioxygenase family protein [Caulobacter sp. S6]QUD86180.1 phytanoyl-CoA dioxygenase family protein [Caulobacter sp. S6]
MPDLAHFPADTSPDDLFAALARDGALVLDDVLDQAAVDALVAEIGPYVEATQPGRDVFSGFNTTRTGALVARSPLTRERVLDTRIRALCDRLLLPFCQRYQLHLTQLIRIMPGQVAQPLHRDRWAWGKHLKDVEPQLNTIWALTDFTRENGATQVAPGSVTWPDERVPDPAAVTCAEMRRGSVLVYTGGVFHGGGANDSQADRWGLNITYALGWLRQEENQYLSCPPEIAATLDPELQALIGYAMGSYALGYYTPPLPAGAGPEVVPPEHALHAGSGEYSMGSDELLAAIRDEIGAAREPA